MIDAIGPSGEIVNPTNPPPPPEPQTVSSEPAPAPLPEDSGTQVDTTA
ncbi:MAG: hypothetical protein LBK13_09890 [Spirochaetales bacterium]|jgi:hypothetical protein|nr:hypothetical protein [Spirochaetales bacterium]